MPWLSLSLSSDHVDETEPILDPSHDEPRIEHRAGDGLPLILCKIVRPHVRVMFSAKSG